jgi:small subunit ribosomal protein S4
LRYAGPRCRLCRREGKKLFLKGLRCTMQKCAFLRHGDVPGKYGKNQTSKKTEYCSQLRAKQSAKRIYNLTEKQFKTYFIKANKRTGTTTEIFQQLLETRLDNAVFRAGFASSRAQARQLVNHGIFQINNYRATIASRQLKIGDKIKIKKAVIDSPLFAGFTKKKDKSPTWLKIDLKELSFEVVALPKLEECEYIDAQTIIEFYSR